MSKWILTGSVAGVVLATTAMLVGYLLVPPIVKKKIIESVQLVKGTEQYDRWVEVPQPLEFKVYIFNVTNQDEIQRGMPPKVHEIGPYVYTQGRKKFNIRFTRDQERASYFSQMAFHFDREKSAPYTEDDHIVVLNMHMNSVLQIIERESRQMISNVTRGVEKTIDRIPLINLVKRFLDRYTPLQSIIQTVESETPDIMGFINPFLHEIFGPVNSFFVSTTPRKFLFEGVEFCKNVTAISEFVCNSVRDRESPSIIRGANGLLFSMFNHKNRTHDGLYEVNTGLRRVRKLLQIERWNQHRTLKFWKADKNGAPSVCQFINGTDATSAGPFREEGDEFYIYSSDICRSVRLQYDMKTSYKGIDALRYSARDDFLKNMPSCFCINKIKGALTQDAPGREGCLLSGALDLTECLDAPIVGTMPHFLGADERYGLLVDGLNPNEEKHNIFIDVEPNTGTPLRGGKRLQFNMFLRKIDQITLSKNFNKTVLFPVLWVEEGLELNDQMTQLIKGDLVNVLQLIAILQWSAFAIGIAMVISFIVWFFISRKPKANRTVSIDPIVAKGEGANSNT